MLDTTKTLQEIIQLSTELNSVQDLDLLLEKILYEARTFLRADAGSIQIREGDELVFSHVQTESIQRKLPPGQKLIYTSFRTKINKSSLSGYVASTGEILNTVDAYSIPKNMPYQFDSSNDKKSGYLTKSMLTIPLKNNRNEILGVMQLINSFKNLPPGKTYEEGSECIASFDEEDEFLALHFANTASIILQRAQMTRVILLRMISMAQLRDPKETGAHVNRVAAYSVELYERWAKLKNIPPKEIEHNKDVLRMAAMLHDVGKVGISDLILKKPGRFTTDEYEIMKKHCFIGAQLFKQKQSEFDEISALVALNHHENWDGTGYPGHIDSETGLPIDPDSEGNALPKKGEDIHIFGRIVALADVYDALSSRRVYKEAWTQDNVVEEIRKESGKKFDPDLVDIFFKSYDFIKSISTRYPDL